MIPLLRLKDSPSGLPFLRGMVPPGCVLSGGTVPPVCVLSGGTVPPFNLSLVTKKYMCKSNKHTSKFIFNYLIRSNYISIHYKSN